jgi:predicted DsbA family dithiol-disulfide isomerase
MAAALFEAEVPSAEVAAERAGLLGLDLDAYRACLAAESTGKRVDADLELFQSVAGVGLPTFYVGRLRLEGRQDADTVRDAIERALP